MIGETLGSFRIVSQLGAGGMGVIYQAEHQIIGKRAAIKVLRPELSADREVIGRFFNEAKAVTAIDHPGLVDVYDFGYAPDGSAYIVMELLSGESLGTRLRRERALPIDAALALTRQLCGALGAAHAHHIVHRDLKPDNIYLTPDPDVAYGLRAKVLDFGIAKLAPGLGGLGTPETRTGMLLGTPLYMAPEQCRGAGEVDHRADIYALGVILFEMICGQVPFTGVGLGEVIAKHQYVAPPSPHTLVPSLSPAVDALILRMLAKPPEHRPQTMHEVLAALDGRTPSQQTAATLTSVAPSLPIGTPPGVSAAPTGPRTTPRKRRGGIYAGLAVVAAGGIAVAAVALHGAKPSAGPLGHLDLLPIDTAFALGIDVARIKTTPLWRDKGSKVIAAKSHPNDELDKLRTSCDMDVFRDLHSVMYAFGTAAAHPGEGAFLVDGDWDRDKLERCFAQMAPELAAQPQPDELAGGPVRQYGDVYIAWIAPHIAAIALAHNGLPFLRQIATHAAPATDRAELQAATAPIAHDAVVWFAGAAPNGLPAGMDLGSGLDHATATWLSITLGDEVDGHFSVTTAPGRAPDLERQIDLALATTRSHMPLKDMPLVDELHVAVHGDTLTIDVHLDAAKLATLEMWIDGALTEAMTPPEPVEPPPTK